MATVITDGGVGSNLKWSQNGELILATSCEKGHYAIICCMLTVKLQISLCMYPHCLIRSSISMYTVVYEELSCADVQACLELHCLLVA